MEKIIINTQGFANGNPGPAAVAARISGADGVVLQELSEMIGNATEEYAEYFAVVRGLQAAIELFGDTTANTSFVLEVSNKTVKLQLNAEQQIQNVGLIGHFVEIHNLRVGSFPNITIAH
jgi:ribonuclease HI